MDKTPKSNDGLDISILKSLFDSSLLGVLILQEGKLVYANSAFCKTFGIDSDCSYQKNQLISSVLAPGFKDEVVERYRSITSGNTETDRGRYEFISDDGEFL
ncbi:MAG: PAS domain-containing protein [Candidatus Thorarchaeota archaeon]